MNTLKNTAFAFRLVALVLAAMSVAIAGCSSSSGVLDGPKTPLINRANSPVWRGGHSSAAVFQSPGVESQLPGDVLAQLPEAARRDGDLSASRPGPLLATSQWPEPAAPSLYERRYLYLPQNPSTYLYFEPEGSRGGRYYRDGGWYGR